MARFGGLDTDEEATPYEIVARQRVYRLRRYLSGDTETEMAPPVLLVPPLMLSAEVYDVSPVASAVRVLREHGADPWVVDYGIPAGEAEAADRGVAG